MAWADLTDIPVPLPYQFVKLFIRTFKVAYPARLECFLVFPSNAFFRAIWCVCLRRSPPAPSNFSPSTHPQNTRIHTSRALVRPFLDAKSRGATFLLQTKAELLEFIAEHQLASFLGGGLPYEPKAEAEAEAETKEEDQAMITA